MLSQGMNVYYISITYIRSSYAFSKPCAYSMLSTFFISPCVRIFFAPLCTAAWTLHLVLPVRIVRFEYSLFLLFLVHPIYLACRVVWMVVDTSHNSECDSFAFFSHLFAQPPGRYTLWFPSALCDLSTPSFFYPWRVLFTLHAVSSGWL